MTLRPGRAPEGVGRRPSQAQVLGHENGQDAGQVLVVLGNHGQVPNPLIWEEGGVKDGENRGKERKRFSE